MTPQEFDALIQAQTRPLVVSFSAAGCGPCNLMDPVMKKVQREFTGRVNTVDVDADGSPDLLSRLGVPDVPALAGYVGGVRVFQQSGIQDITSLRRFFRTVLECQDEVGEPSFYDRLLRSLSGFALIAFWALSGWHWAFLILGVFLVVCAFYDRCRMLWSLIPRLADLINGRRGAGKPA